MTTTSNVSEPLPADGLTRTASIIPFPTRIKLAEVAPEETGEQRLARALASLNAALAEQRIAVAAWRDVLGQLKVSTDGLSDSLQRYRTNLDTLGTSVSTLKDKAVTLEEWANGVITSKT